MITKELIRNKRSVDILRVRFKSETGSKANNVFTGLAKGLMHTESENHQERLCYSYMHDLQKTQVNSPGE